MNELLLASLVEHARAATDFSQEECDTRCGFAPGTVARIEQGVDLRPPVEVLEPLAYLLAASFGRFLVASGLLGPSGPGEIGEVARLVIEPGQTEGVLDLLKQFTEGHVAQEPGTIDFSWHVSSEDASTLWLYELFADEEALVKHFDSNEHRELKLAIGEKVHDASLHFFRRRFGVR